MISRREKIVNSVMKNANIKDEIFSVTKFNEIEDEKGGEVREYDDTGIQEIEGFEACK